jgi:hypothetical protein
MEAPYIFMISLQYLLTILNKVILFITFSQFNSEGMEGEFEGRVGDTYEKVPQSSLQKLLSSYPSNTIPA